MKKCKKLILVLGAFILSVILVAFIGLKIYLAVPQENPSVILLAFDDYYEENWEQYFDYFDENDVKVTFFVNSATPTEFCMEAVERGHEIGFHTMQHVDLTTASEEEVREQAIVPIEDFRKAGIEMTTFAYPYGEYTEELNRELLQYYKVLRGGFYYEPAPKDNFKSGFVESKPIDNNKFESELQFRWVINKMLYEARFNEGTVVSIYSHGIESGEYCITPERMEYIIQKAKDLNLEFCTYQDLQ